MIIPTDWEVYDFPKTLVKNKVGRDNQINASEIKSSGKYPIIDQGQDYIAGYSDDKDKVYEPEQPLVIFGDHTRCFKYVHFPFIIGADGTKILAPNTTLFNPKFFYFYLLSLHIPSRGYNRHFKLLKEQRILRPPIPEQHNIAHILSKIQSAIEAREKIIQTTTELKKALMQKLFTEGLKGEPQKETEIGLAPESWEIKKLGDYATLITKGASPKWQGFNYCENGVMFIRSQNIGWGDVIKTGSTYLPETFNKTQKRSILKADDVLVNLVGASIGRVAVAPREFEGANINQAVALVRVKKESYPPKFIMYFLLTDMGQFLIKRQVKAIARGNISLEDVSNFFVPMPTISEQEEIVNTLTMIDEKHKFVIAKKQILINLFSSMLHHLMTGQIRVKDLRFS